MALHCAENFKLSSYKFNVKIALIYTNNKVKHILASYKRRH